MRFRCRNPQCGQFPRGYEFEADLPICPKCGWCNPPQVHELVDVHFLVMGYGPMTGQHGMFHVACEPTREYLAAHAFDRYAATDVPSCVTCPSCMGTQIFQDMLKALQPTIWRELQMKKQNQPAPTIVDCGCGN